MNHLHRFFIVCAALLLIVPAATANWSENFDSYANNSSIDGQGGWAGWGGASGCDAFVTNIHSYSTPHSLGVIPTTDIVQTFSENTGQWDMTAWCYIPTGSTGDTYFIMLNTYILPSTYDWSVQLKFDNDDNTVYNTMFGSSATAPIVYDTWTEVKIEIFLDTNTQSTYYNGNFMDSTVWQEESVNEIAALDLFSAGGSTIFWDDLDLILNTALERTTWGEIKTIMQ
jgi:hypothetical protein